MKHGEKEELLESLYRPPISPDYSSKYFQLDHNESPFGLYNKYPDVYPLYKDISERFGLSISNVLVTAGSERALSYVYSVFVEPGSKVVRPEPTFGMTEVYEHLNQAQVDKVDYDEDGFMEVDALCSRIDSDTQLVYIASPDNITGFAWPSWHMSRIITTAHDHGALVLLDKAYQAFDFVGTNKLIHDYANVLVVYAFSKIYGMAGLRIGFMLGRGANMELLHKIRPMEPVSTPAIRYARRMLGNAGRRMENKYGKHIDKWKALFKGINKTPSLRCRSNCGPFIIIQSIDKDIEYYANMLKKNHCIVRSNFKHPSMKNCMRISVGPGYAMHRVLRLLLQHAQ